MTDENYQCLLVKSYAFAEDKRIKEMMNDVMPIFIQTLSVTKLIQESLQMCLHIAPRQSMLRMAVLEEALKIKDEDGNRMLNKLDRRWLLGIDGDVSTATARFDQRGGFRGATPEYFVELDAIPLPRQSLGKRTRPPSSVRHDSAVAEDHDQAQPQSPIQPEREADPDFDHIYTHPERADIHLHPTTGRHLTQYDPNYLLVTHPTMCECIWDQRVKKLYPKVAGEELARNCFKCGRYRRPVQGKKFAWREYTRKWMWVPLGALDGYGPADGDEVEGWVERQGGRRIGVYDRQWM